MITNLIFQSMILYLATKCSGSQKAIEMDSDKQLSIVRVHRTRNPYSRNPLLHKKLIHPTNINSADQYLDYNHLKHPIHFIRLNTRNRTKNPKTYVFVRQSFARLYLSNSIIDTHKEAVDKNILPVSDIVLDTSKKSRLKQQSQNKKPLNKSKLRHKRQSLLPNAVKPQVISPVHRPHLVMPTDATLPMQGQIVDLPVPLPTRIVGHANILNSPSQYPQQHIAQQPSLQHHLPNSLSQQTHSGLQERHLLGAQTSNQGQLHQTGHVSGDVPSSFVQSQQNSYLSLTSSQNNQPAPENHMPSNNMHLYNQHYQGLNSGSYYHDPSYQSTQHNLRYASKGCVGMPTLRQSSNIIHCMHGCKIVIQSVIYGTNLECPTEITSPVSPVCCGWNDASDCVTVFGPDARVTKQTQWACQQDSSCALRVDRRTMYGPPSHCTQPGYNTFRQIHFSCDCRPDTTVVINLLTNPVTATTVEPYFDITQPSPVVSTDYFPKTTAYWSVTQAADTKTPATTVYPSTRNTTETTKQIGVTWTEVIDNSEVVLKAQNEAELGTIIGVAAGVFCVIVCLLIMGVLLIRKRRRMLAKKAEGDDWSLGGQDYASIDECHMNTSQSANSTEPYYSSPPSIRDSIYYTNKDDIELTQKDTTGIPTSHQLQQQKIALKPAASKLRAGFEMINLAIATHVNKQHHGYYSPGSNKSSPTGAVVQIGTSEYGGLYQQAPQRATFPRPAPGMYDHLNMPKISTISHGSCLSTMQPQRPPRRMNDSDC